MLGKHKRKFFSFNFLLIFSSKIFSSVRNFATFVRNAEKWLFKVDYFEPIFSTPPFCNATTQHIALYIALNICSRIQNLHYPFLGQSNFVCQILKKIKHRNCRSGLFALPSVCASHCSCLALLPFGERWAYVGTFLVAFLKLLPAFLQLALDQLFSPIPSESWLKEPKHLSREEWRPFSATITGAGCFHIFLMR